MTGPPGYVGKPRPLGNKVSGFFELICVPQAKTISGQFLFFFPWFFSSVASRPASVVNAFCSTAKRPLPIKRPASAPHAQIFAALAS